MTEKMDPCPCAACVDWREDESLSMRQTICFEKLGPGHGPCLDGWDTGCVCVGTAADGECEACWLWMK